MNGTLQVVCLKRRSEAKTFTEGKVYEAYKERGKEYCRTWMVTDDHGHQRCIIPNEPYDPHLPPPYHYFSRWDAEMFGGRFVTLPTIDA